MSTVKDYKLELIDFEQVALEKRDKNLKFEIAINMLEMGLDIKVISKATGLTILEVEELKKNLK